MQTWTAFSTVDSEVEGLQPSQNTLRSMASKYCTEIEYKNCHFKISKEIAALMKQQTVGITVFLYDFHSAFPRAISADFSGF